MATTFTWSITGLERLSSNDGIKQADWMCSASDFIDYADLTEANVLGWVQFVVGKNLTETQLQAMLDEKKAPTTALGVPW